MVYTNYLTNCPHCNTLCKIVDHAIPTQKEKNTFSKAIIAASIQPNTHGWGRGEAWKLLSVKGDNLLLPIMGLLRPNPGAQGENPTSQPPEAVAWPPFTRVCPLTRLLTTHFWCLVPFLFRKNERVYILG